jgi:hypothetical protein
MTHVSRKRRQFLLFAVDLLILYSLIPLTLLVRNMEIPTFWYVLEHAVGFTAVIAIWELISYGVGLYSLDKPFTSSQAFIKMMIVASVSMLSGFALFYLFLSGVITPKTVLLLYSAFSFVLLMLWRVLYDYFFGIRKRKPKVAFVGFNETVASLIREMRRSSYFGFTTLVVYDPDPSAGQEVAVTDPAIPFVSDQDEFVRFIQGSGVDIVILAREKSFPLAVRQTLFALLENEVGFYNLPDFFEVVTRKIPIGSINDNWLLSHLDAQGEPSSRSLSGIRPRLLAFDAGGERPSLAADRRRHQARKPGASILQANQGREERQDLHDTEVSHYARRRERLYPHGRRGLAHHADRKPVAQEPARRDPAGSQRLHRRHVVDRAPSGASGAGRRAREGHSLLSPATHRETGITGGTRYRGNTTRRPWRTPTRSYSSTYTISRTGPFSRPFHRG